MEKDRARFLIERLIDGKANKAETDELASLLDNLEANGGGRDWLDALWDELANQELDDMHAVRRDLIRDDILKKPRRFSMLQRKWWWAAAVTVLMIGVFKWVHHVGSSVKDQEVYDLKSPLVAEIEPGGSKAILTLGDGRRVVLDDLGGDTLVAPHVSMRRSGSGEIAYDHLGNDQLGLEPEYHTIETPKGGEYRVLLADGTKVMLNALSTLTYPVYFNALNRTVEFTGEGYFEVSPDALKPFQVITNMGDEQQVVEVLGTEFNINAYGKSASIRTAVEQGRVKVYNKEAGEALVTPGKQAVLTFGANEGAKMEVENADLDEIMAWKDGLLIFNNAKLPEMLVQLERWYDVDFVYKDNVERVHFQGNYFRNKGLLNLLRNLEMTGEVKFEFENGRESNDRKTRRIYVRKN